MKSVKKTTSQIAAVLLSGMLATASVPVAAFGTEVDVDSEQSTDIIVEDTGENNSEGDVVEQYSDVATQEEGTVESYTVTLDANGGYFVNEWDDSLNEALETAETVTKLIPTGGTVASFPVLEQENAVVTFLGWSLEPNGELVSQGYEEYVPVDNCVLYAVWQVQKSSDMDTDQQQSEHEQIYGLDIIESGEGIEEVTSEQDKDDGNNIDSQNIYPQVSFEEEEILAVAGYNKHLDFSATNFQGEYLDCDLIWESSRPDIALISSEGYLQPLRAGNTTVSLSVEGTDIVASCQVTVVDPEVESEYHLTKKDFEEVQEAEPGLIVGGLRKNKYGNVILLPGKYIISEDICLDDMGKFYYEDDGLYTFSGEGSFYDSKIGYDGNWSTGTANYLFEDFKLDNVYISCYGIKILSGDYKDLTLDIEYGSSIDDPGIYGGHFEGFGLWNENYFDYDNRFTINGGEFLNGYITGRGWSTNIIDGSFKDVCVEGSCLIFGGLFVTEKNDYAISVGSDRGQVFVYGGYFKGKIAAATSMKPDCLYLHGGTFENGQVGAVIIPTGNSSHQEAGKTIKELLKPYEFKKAEYFEIVMDGGYFDVAQGIDGYLDIGFNIENYDLLVSDAVYTGRNIIPEYSFYYSDTTYYPDLILDSDYELEIENNLNVGIGRLTITGKGDYFGTITSTFKINPASISDATFTSLSDITYTGKAITQTPIVEIDSIILKEDTDYTIDHNNNINVGTATITITGKGNYTGTKTATFKIEPASITDAVVTSIPTKTYTGQAITQKPVVKSGSTTLIEGSDYTVSYKNNTNPGTATVIITGSGNYTGTKEVTFTINAVGWIQESGEWYYYKNDGTRLTNGWAKDSKGWYWLDASGKITKSKWIKSGGSWYYLGSDGIMTTGWQKVGGKWFYMNSSGIMTTGWQKIGGKWYYMNSSGAMTTGWQKIGGKWYYMNSSGVMTTGWQKIGGKWYYMKADGTMATGTQTIGGKTYKFNSSGVWIQ